MTNRQLISWRQTSLNNRVLSNWLFHDRRHACTALQPSRHLQRTCDTTWHAVAASNASERASQLAITRPASTPSLRGGLCAEYSPPVIHCFITALERRLCSSSKLFRHCLLGFRRKLNPSQALTVTAEARLLRLQEAPPPAQPQH